MWTSPRATRTLMVLALLSACSSEKPRTTTRDPRFDNPSTLAGRGILASGAGSPGLSDGQCANGQVVATRITPRVVLVLDGSCSMSTNYPANGAESASECTENQNGRWAALRRALVDPQTGVVSRLQHAVEFGMVVYGTTPNCPIAAGPVRPRLDSLERIESALPDVQPGMYTPTGPALEWVFENLIEAPGPDTNLGPQIVILATDGEPNSCGRGFQGPTTDYQPSIDAMAAGQAKGATTYVISLADATGPFHDHLQQLANLGDPAANGAAKLYEPTTPEQLEANLASLVTAAVGCDVELNGLVDPMHACTGKVSLNGTPLACNDPNGWVLLDERHIRLQGSACQTIMADQTANIQADFECTIFNPD